MSAKELKIEENDGIRCVPGLTMNDSTDCASGESARRSNKETRMLVVTSVLYDLFWKFLEKLDGCSCMNASKIRL